MAAELERDTVRRENNALVIRVKALIVNVSPTVASAHETKESLRFAQDAKKVKLGEASRDVDRA